MPVQVESIMAGDGKHYPYERQTVTLHYVGYLDRAGQKKFDSTFERGTCMPTCISPGAGSLAESGPCSPAVSARRRHGCGRLSASPEFKLACARLTHIRMRGRLCPAGPIDPKTKKPTGRHFKFRVKSGQVVKGWDDGISQLSLGEKARITIPAGERDFNLPRFLCYAGATFLFTAFRVRDFALAMAAY